MPRSNSIILGEVHNSHSMSPMISAPRIAYWILRKSRASLVHVHSAAIKHRSIQCRNGALGFRHLRHLHESDATGFARIPVFHHRNGFDGSMGCKKFTQLLLRHRDIQVPDKNVNQSSFFLIFAT